MMRLTLRTLMAYRDGVLSTAETSDLHKRIKQSEVAGNLLRRIEAVVQRTQIAAPNVDGTGLGGDANTVAEYLDDALPGEQVPEFERICIVESDVQLAELAHCHQLLADAMHSQVRVPKQLKALIVGLSESANRQQLEQRLIGDSNTVEAVIVAEPQSHAGTGRTNHTAVRRADSTENQLRVDSPHTASSSLAANTAAAGNNASGSSVSDNHSASASDSATSGSAAADSSSERPQVQAPMVTSGGGSIKPHGLDLEGAQLAHEIPEYLIGSGRGGWRIPLSICAMIGLLAFLSWQALGPIEGVKQLFDSQHSLAARSAANNSSAKAASGAINSASADAGLGANGSNGVNGLNGAGSALPEESNANVKDLEPQPKAVPTPADATASEAAAAVVAPPANGAATANGKAAANAAGKLPGDSSRIEKPLASAGPQSPPAELPPSPRSKSVVWTPSGASEERAVVLARHISPEGQFSLIRLAPGTPAARGAGIVIPPATRTTLDLAGGSKWTVCGPTQLEVPPRDDEETLVMTPLCRALVQAGTHGNFIRIATPAGAVALQFLNGSCMAGVEVTYRPVASGLVSDSEAYKPLLIIVAVEGDVAVLYQEDKLPKEQKLAIGDGLALIDGKPRLFKLGEIPDWYRGENSRPLDEQAAVDLHRQLAPGAEVGDALLQLCGNRRPETAALAVQSSMLLGDWSAFASGFLASEAMRSHWTPTLGLAEQMIASEAGNATSLQAALEAAYPARGQKLFELINGIPADEQPSSFLPRLIDTLESPELDERVVAFNDLRKLTGKDFGYQPQTASRASVQQWRRELTGNRLKLNMIGDPLWEAK